MCLRPPTPFGQRLWPERGLLCFRAPVMRTERPLRSISLSASSVAQYQQRVVWSHSRIPTFNPTTGCEIGLGAARGPPALSKGQFGPVPAFRTRHVERAAHSRHVTGRDTKPSADLEHWLGPHQFVECLAGQLRVALPGPG